MNSFQKDFPKTYNWLHEDIISKHEPLQEMFGFIKKLFTKTPEQIAYNTWEKEQKLIEKEIENCSRMSNDKIAICINNGYIKRAQSDIKMLNALDCSKSHDPKECNKNTHVFIKDRQQAIKKYQKRIKEYKI